MERRNLDIFAAGGAGLLGGAAYVAHAPGPIQVILGISLFFAPGYLWSVAILSQRLSGLERTLTSGGLALIFPIIGGFVFYGLRIPLFRSAWVGLLVVLTLLGVVAVAVQRLREPVADLRQAPAGRGPGGRPQPRTSRLSPVNAAIYGAAALVGLGAVAFSVHSAQAQKVPGYSSIGMAGLQKVNPTQANLTAQNQEGATERYEIKLYRKGKLAETYKFTLANNQSWHKVIAYTVAQGDGISAYLYLLPDTSKWIEYADNGQTTKNPNS